MLESRLQVAVMLLKRSLDEIDFSSDRLEAQMSNPLSVYLSAVVCGRIKCQVSYVNSE